MSNKKRNFSIRTDLALEACESIRLNKEIIADGIISTVEQIEGMEITCVEIINENGAEAVNKPIGKYITIETEKMKENDVEYREKIIRETAKNLLSLYNPKNIKMY